jgi:transposase InsO family protein
MSDTIAQPSERSNKIYGGVIFDETNYSPWLNDLYKAIKWNKLARWSIPLEPGGDKVAKEKPKGTGDDAEDWEDHADQALVLINESLGDRWWIIENCKTPVEAFKLLHTTYSGATSNDATRLEARWVNERPHGDDFMEYVGTMTAIRDKLKIIKVERTEQDLCLRMMSPLSEYEEGHPYRKAWEWLDKTFTDDATKIKLEYFRRFVLAAAEKLEDYRAKRPAPPLPRRNTAQDHDSHSLVTIATLVDELRELRALVTTTPGPTSRDRGRFDRYDRSSGCNFCHNPRHATRDCNHPDFDINRYNRDRERGRRGPQDIKGGGKEKQGPVKRGGHRAHWAEDDRGSRGSRRGSDVSDVGASTTKMNKSSDCYTQIGKHPSPGMDPGAAYEGGDLCDASLEPPVRSPRPEDKIEDTNAADRDGVTMSSFSESIFEQLYHATISNTSISTTATILDSGCTRTMWRDIEMFESSPNYRSCHIGVKVGDGHTIYAKGMGDVSFRIEGGQTVVVPGCLWVPDLKLNLVSVSHLDGEGFSTKFDQGQSVISFQGQAVLNGERRSNLYYLDVCPPTCQSAHSVVTPEVLHRRMGHFAMRRIRRMGDLVEGLDIDDMKRLSDKMYCDSCARAKSKRAAFPASETKTTSILEHLSMDIAGPAEVESVGGKRYISIIADDYSRYYHSILLVRKSDAMQEALKWIALQERRTGLKVKRIRSDNGGEILSDEWTEYYSRNGIMHERTVPYSPEQNGKAERAVGIVKDGIGTYLLESGLSRGYWGAAAINFTHTVKRQVTFPERNSARSQDQRFHKFNSQWSVIFAA